jgi:hypothetical protein
MTNLSKRSAGKPRFGRVSFRAKRLLHLPAEGTATDYARVLGVTRNAVLYWIEVLGLPAKQKKTGGHVIRKLEFKEWAKRVKKFNPIRG